MQRVLTMLVFLFVFLSQTFAQEQVRKANHSKVSFGGMGTVTVDKEEVISENIKAVKSKNKGKWKGITGKLLGKFFPKGDDQIIDLTELKVYKLNRKKKKCESRPLITEESKEAQKSLKGVFQQMNAEQDKYEQAEEEEKKKRTEILAQVFEVKSLNETVTHGVYDCSKFLITLYTKTRDTETEVIRVDSISVNTDMTKITDEIQKALKIERTFGQNYFEKLGLEFNFMQRGLFGLDWMEKFNQAKKDQDVAVATHPDMAAQLGKLKGYYPVFTHGRIYGYVANQGNKTNISEEAEPEDIKKKGFGFAKSIFGKKKKDKKPAGPKPVLEFEDKLLALELGEFADRLTPPFKCKEK